MLKENMKIVFFGDSVTDTCCRVDKDYPWGSGYVSMLNNHITTNFGDLNVKVYNEGISGNRTIDLRNRVSDVTKHNPDLVFILIGVNDAWRKYDMNDETTDEQFKENYISIIEQLLANNRDLKIVIAAPFSLSITELASVFEDELAKKRKIVIELAKQYNFELVMLNEVFDETAKIINPFRLTVEGIHPTLIGHALIAEKFLEIILK